MLPAVCVLVLSFEKAANSQPLEGRPAEAPAPLAQSDQTSPASLLLTVGKSLIVDNALPIERISVGFGDIAEATAIGPRELLLNGKAPGVTSLIIWQEGVACTPGRPRSRTTTSSC